MLTTAKGTAGEKACSSQSNTKESQQTKHFSCPKHEGGVHVKLTPIQKALLVTLLQHSPLLFCGDIIKVQRRLQIKTNTFPLVNRREQSHYYY